MNMSMSEFNGRFVFQRDQAAKINKSPQRQKHPARTRRYEPDVSVCLSRMFRFVCESLTTRIPRP